MPQRYLPMRMTVVGVLVLSALGDAQALTLSLSGSSQVGSGAFLEVLTYAPSGVQIVNHRDAEHRIEYQGLLDSQALTISNLILDISLPAALDESFSGGFGPVSVFEEFETTTTTYPVDPSLCGGVFPPPECLQDPVTTTETTRTDLGTATRTYDTRIYNSANAYPSVLQINPDGKTEMLPIMTWYGEYDVLDYLDGELVRQSQGTSVLYVLMGQFICGGTSVSPFCWLYLPELPRGANLVEFGTAGTFSSFVGREPNPQTRFPIVNFPAIAARVSYVPEPSITVLTALGLAVLSSFRRAGAGAGRVDHRVVCDVNEPGGHSLPQ